MPILIGSMNDSVIPAMSGTLTRIPKSSDTFLKLISHPISIAPLNIDTLYTALVKCQFHSAL